MRTWMTQVFSCAWLNGSIELIHRTLTYESCFYIYTQCWRLDAINMLICISSTGVMRQEQTNRPWCCLPALQMLTMISRYSVAWRRHAGPKRAIPSQTLTLTQQHARPYLSSLGRLQGITCPQPLPSAAGGFWCFRQTHLAWTTKDKARTDSRENNTRTTSAAVIWRCHELRASPSHCFTWSFNTQSTMRSSAALR